MSRSFHRAGSKINRDLAASPRDATLIERMEPRVRCWSARSTW